MGGEVAVDRQPVVSIGPPLRGEGYISADSCCDASRHTRAAMPVNGRVWLAQRFAVDWEQLDAQGRDLCGRSREARELYDLWQAGACGCRRCRRVGDRWAAGADAGEISHQYFAG